MRPGTMSNRGFDDDGGPVPTVDFDFDSIDGEPILAEGRRAPGIRCRGHA